MSGRHAELSLQFQLAAGRTGRLLTPANQFLEFVAAAAADKLINRHQKGSQGSNACLLGQVTLFYAMGLRNGSRPPGLMTIPTLNS